MMGRAGHEMVCHPFPDARRRELDGPWLANAIVKKDVVPWRRKRKAGCRGRTSEGGRGGLTVARADRTIPLTSEALSGSMVGGSRGSRPETRRTPNPGFQGCLVRASGSG